MVFGVGVVESRAAVQGLPLLMVVDVVFREGGVGAWQQCRVCQC